MATYKVIQDIEAEDHILGPLSLRQFIFGLGAALCFYLCYIVASKGAGFLMVLFLPPGLFAAFFAIPFGRDQPTEIWALAKIRFYFKPRKRIWDQSGMKDLVAITVPKKIEVRRTDGLSQTEVRSRLSALANTIDTRGWVVKDVNLSKYTRPGLLEEDDASSDRLVELSSMPVEVPTYDITASDDMLDEQSNPIARQFDQMINASSQAHHQQLVDMLHTEASAQPTPAAAPSDQNGWFMQQASPQMPSTPAQAAAPPALMPTPSSAGDDSATSSQLRAQTHAQDGVYGHLKTIQPLSAQAAQPAQAAIPAPPPPTPTVDATQLAANNDLNIATIARVANKQDLPDGDEGGEVVIPLR